jgi:dinuclear metal center YbgI/SA1388 family protein
MGASLADVVDAIEALYPPQLAASWDSIGLVCGDPTQAVASILFAVDPVAVVVDEAIERGVDLLVTHHPLFLRGTSSVAATTAKGSVIHRLIRAGIGLQVAHTNADHARPGVSDALAEALGLADLRPLDPQPAEPLDKLVVFVPQSDADRLLGALSIAGAGEIGDYSRCAWTSSGIGTFVPGPGAAPALGAVGSIVQVAETRLEMVLHRRLRNRVIAALRSAHPYEEPAFDVLELASWPGETGTGRVGSLPAPMTLSAFAAMAGAALPASRAGGRVAGDLDAIVRSVAVCGGAGDSYLGHATAAGADVYLTADLRHHVVSEHLADGGCALVELSHWSTEWPWLPVASRQLTSALAERGATVTTVVSTKITDAWSASVASSPPTEAAFTDTPFVALPKESR